MGWNVCVVRFSCGDLIVYFLGLGELCLLWLSICGWLYVVVGYVLGFWCLRFGVACYFVC